MVNKGIFLKKVDKKKMIIIYIKKLLINFLTKFQRFMYVFYEPKADRFLLIDSGWIDLTESTGLKCV